MHFKIFIFVLVFVVARAAFVPLKSPERNSVTLNLERKIAEMLDKEYYSRTHPEEAQVQEELIRKRNADYVSDDLPGNFQGVDMIRSDSKDFAQYRKDKNLASKDPQAYCAERCVSTGNCEVYEDIFDFSPEEVIKFCTDCVLSEDEEPCDVPPEKMTDNILKP